MSQDYIDSVCETLISGKFVETGEQCTTCKFYRNGKCKKERYNNVAPFLGCEKCYKNMNLKEKIVVKICSLVVICN